MKCWFPPLLLLSLFTIGSAATGAPEGRPEGAALLASDAHGLTLEIQTPAFRLAESPGVPGTRLAVEGWGRTTRPGEPDLPVFSTLIQVPPTGGVRTTLAVQASHRVDDFHPAVTPTLSADLAEDGTAAVLRRHPALPTSGVFPTEIAALSERLHFQGTCLLRLEVRPFRWDAAQQALTVIDRLTLQVEFDDPLTAAKTDIPGESPAEALFEDLKQRLVLNRCPGADQPPVAKAPATASPALESEAVKIQVRQTGMVAVAYEALAAAGLPFSSADPATFRLTCGGEDIAFCTSRPDGGLGPGDALEFYGQALDTPYTDANVYWLTWGGAPGPRMGQSDGTPGGAETLAPWFYQSIRIEQNNTWWGSTPGAPEADYWFWEKLTAPVTASYALQFPSNAPASGGLAYLSVVMRGRSDTPTHPNHHTRFAFNNAPMGDFTWDGMAEATFTLAVPMAYFKPGDNTLTITLPNDTGSTVDIANFNRVDAVYASTFQAEGDTLAFQFNVQAPTLFEVSGFTQPSLRIFEVTDPRNPVEITGVQVQAFGGGYKASFAAKENSLRRWVAVGGNGWGEASRVQLRQPQHLDSPTHGADYLLVTAEEFLPAVAPLVEYRQGQGLRVFAVGVETLYDEFNDGIVSPFAIKSFLQTAYTRWQSPRPAYVLFIGDANADYRGYLPSSRPSRVPAYLTYTSNLGLTPVDNWFVCLTGSDPVPEMFQGRLPAATAEAAGRVAEKVIRYDSDPSAAPPTVLMSVDNNDPAFETIADQASSFVPAAYPQREVYLSRYTDFAKAKKDVYDTFNAGLTIANWVGHGDVTHWAGERIIESTSDIGLLQAGMPLMFMASTSCLNGYFVIPAYYCLGDEFLAAVDKGNAASFVSAGMTYDWENQEIDLNLFRRLFETGETLLGPLTLRSRLEAYRNGATALALDTYQLLGDPAMRLRTVPLGDVNADGVFDAADLLTMAQAAAGWFLEYAPPCRVPAAGDFNRNRIIDAMDLVMAMAAVTDTP